MKLNPVAALGVALLFLGTLGIASALLSGQAHFALVLIIPVIYGSSPWLALGALSLVAGVFLVFTSVAATWEFDSPSPPPLPSERPPSTPSGSIAHDSKVTYGGFLLVGPVPIAFGNRSQLLPYVIVMGVLMVLAVLLVVYFW